MKIEENIPLKDFTTLEVGGAADFFTRVKSGEELKKALAFADKKKIPFFILGGGSNLLFLDEGYRGLVIKDEIQNVEFEENTVKVGSGVMLAALVMESARRGLAGLEQFAGIPGNVGGAVVGNANGIGEVVKKVKVLNAEGEEVIFFQEHLEFDYRKSALQDTKSFLIEAEFELKETEKDLQQEVGEIAREKALKQPYAKTAGSWFKNPSFAPSELRRACPQQMRAWELIDQAGCRGLIVGDAVISERHANFFQNAGKATTNDFLELEKKVVKKVEEKFGVRLEREVVVVN